jgi:hypothetical protein
MQLGGILEGVPALRVEPPGRDQGHTGGLPRVTGDALLARRCPTDGPLHSRPRQRPERWPCWLRTFPYPRGVFRYRLSGVAGLGAARDPVFRGSSAAAVRA